MKVTTLNGFCGSDHKPGFLKFGNKCSFNCELRGITRKFQLGRTQLEEGGIELEQSSRGKLPRGGKGCKVDKNKTVKFSFLHHRNVQDRVINGQVSSQGVGESSWLGVPAVSCCYSMKKVGEYNRRPTDVSGLSGCRKGSFTQKYQHEKVELLFKFVQSDFITKQCLQLYLSLYF